MFSLHSYRLVFRPLRREHLEMTRQWRNASRDAFIMSDAITESGHAAWFEQYLGRHARLGDTIWIGYDGGEPVCQVALYNFDEHDYSAVFGRLVVAPTQRRHGYAREAVSTMQTLFRAIGLLTLRLTVKVNNYSARDLYERSGFVIYNTDERVVSMEWTPAQP